jgi:hypothetical protein
MLVRNVRTKGNRVRVYLFSSLYISCLSAATMSHPFHQMGDVREWLRRADTGRCHLLEHAAWWGIQGPLSTRIFFGGGRVGQAWCGGRRPSRRWYIDVLERRTSTSVATFICWIGILTGVGRFFRDLTLAMIPLAFHISGLLPSVAQHQVNIDYSWCAM